MQQLDEVLSVNGRIVISLGHVIRLCKTRANPEKGVQTTFFIPLGFQIESLKAKRYKDHMNKKGIKSRVGMTLRSLKTYGYIGSKTKSYQI